jgi:hypothetical protein
MENIMPINFSSLGGGGGAAAVNYYSADAGESVSLPVSGAGYYKLSARAQGGASTSTPSVGYKVYDNTLAQTQSGNFLDTLETTAQNNSEIILYLSSTETVIILAFTHNNTVVSLEYFAPGELSNFTVVKTLSSQSLTFTSNTKVVALGGGGGGGGSHYGNTAYRAGGGGSGYFALGNLPAGTYSVTIGQGGIGGNGHEDTGNNTATNGTSGGTTSIGGINASGGNGGYASNLSGDGGDGGSGGAGNASSAQGGFNGSDGGGANYGAGSGIEAPGYIGEVSVSRGGSNPAGFYNGGGSGVYPNYNQSAPANTGGGGSGGGAHEGGTNGGSGVLFTIAL